VKRVSARAVGDLLVDALPALAERLTAHRIRQSWASVVGTDVARRTQPGSLVHGCLTVTVDNSPWLHELTLRRDELTPRLRAEFVDIRSVRFVLGPLDPERPGAPPTPREPQPVRLSGRELEEIDEAAATITDGELAAVARRLMTRARQLSGTRGAAR
jgi:hypothetical protein